MFETDAMTAKFNRALSKDYHWTSEALEVIENKFDIDTSDYLCGGGNTYNNDNDLSQDFQYEIFTYEGDHYCIFQLHNGADIRGGYTDSQVFKISDIDYFHCWMCDWYDHETGEEWETTYQISEDERTRYNEDKECYMFEGREIYPYSSAMGL